MSPKEFITLYATFRQGNTSMCSFKYAILVQTSIGKLFSLCQWCCPYLNYRVPKVFKNMNMKMNMKHWWNNWQGKAIVLKKNPIMVLLFPQKNPIRTAQGLNTGLHTDKPEMNCHHSFVQNTMERMLRTTDG